MNLKEAFRYQNKLQKVIDMSGNLLYERNVVLVKETLLRSKVMDGAQDETVLIEPQIEYHEHITDLACLFVSMMEEKEKLSAAIRNVKKDLPIDIDAEVNLNSSRQMLAKTFRDMSKIKASETTIPNGGVGYRFKEDGEQVTYKCDLKRVTTINFDRNVVRKLQAKLNARAEEVSAEIDRAMVNTEVDYEPVFDVNDTFADIFEDYLDQTVS